MEQQPQPIVGLQLADLLFVAKMIQAMAQRGSFRADEMAEVGTFYNKLVEFLSASGAIQPAGSAQTQTPEEK